MRRFKCFLFLSLLAASSSAFAGGGGGGDYSGPSWEDVLGFVGFLVALFLVFVAIPAWFRNCRANKQRQARIAKAWVAELNKPLEPVYRAPA